MNRRCPRRRSSIAGQQRVRERYRCAQVDIERAVELLDVNASSGPTPAARRWRRGCRPRRPRRAAVSTSRRLVEVDGHRARAELGRERLEHVAAPAGQDQLRAARVQRARDRLADSTGGAGERATVEPREIAPSCGAYRVGCETLAIRVVRPDGRRQDRDSRRAGRAAARARRAIRSPSPPTRCRSTRASRRSPGLPRAAEQRGASSIACLVPATRRDASASGEYAQLAHAEIDDLLAAGGARSSSAAPACTCAPRSPSSTCARRRPKAARALDGRAASATAPPALHARLGAPRRLGGRGRSSRTTASGSCVRWSCSSSGELEPPRGAVAAVERASCATRRCSRG